MIFGPASQSVARLVCDKQDTSAALVPIPPTIAEYRILKRYPIVPAVMCEQKSSVKLQKEGIKHHGNISLQK